MCALHVKAQQNINLSYKINQPDKRLLGYTISHARTLNRDFRCFCTSPKDENEQLHVDLTRWLHVDP